MRTLRIALGDRSYPIRLGSGLLGRAASFPEAAGRPLRLITDRNVARRYLPQVRAALGLDRGDCLVLPAGEDVKSLATASRVLDWLLAGRLPRDGLIVALGGGVMGDLAGFVASIYQRGVDFIQVPTTLLAQVDSSVGGKTGVNHPRGKNLIGAFHQPRAVVADADTLRTLPPRELAAGLAEVIKYGMLGDARFFGWLERAMPQLLALDPATVARAVEHCCRMKADVVAQDEHEGGVRALLNLGHTFGHAIEAHVRYRGWLHGEAVAVGLCMAADLSRRLGWISARDAARCEALVRAAGLPVRPPRGMKPAHFAALMKLDKKVKGGKVRLVLLRRLGDAVITADAAPAAVRATLAHFCDARG